jgi:prevent-host-death family protein
VKTTVISVTEAARNFADCVNRAHYQGVTFVLVKNGAPVARIVPHEGKTCTGKDLAEALRDVKLSTENAKAWHRDLKKGRKILKAPENKWQ